jgi:acyl-CoA thioester hydrolase
MSPDNFKYSLAVSPRFADFDALGHVNNAKYITYLEEARVRYALQVFGLNLFAEDQGMILARTTIDYLLPIRAGQDIQVMVRCARLGRKSFDLSYIISRAADQALVSTASTTIVAYDYKIAKSILIPDSWRQAITAYEKVAPETA